LREARLLYHLGVDSRDTLGQRGHQFAELHEIVQVRGGIPVIKVMPGLAALSASCRARCTPIVVGSVLLISLLG
jgi:hypothetical protein